MLERIGEFAEQGATSVSRREVLGRLGRGAMALSAGLAGMLALPGAGKPPAAPRSCDGNSTHECFGLNEGDVCYVGAYRSLCTGPKQPPSKRGTSTTCSCPVSGDVR